MSDNEEQRNRNNIKYSNLGTKEDPITRSEYNARQKMCPKCLRSNAAVRNTFLREDLGSIGVFAGTFGLFGGLPGAAMGGALGFCNYLYLPVRYTCKFCGATFLVNKWF